MNWKPLETLKTLETRKKNIYLATRLVRIEFPTHQKQLQLPAKIQKYKNLLFATTTPAPIISSSLFYVFLNIGNEKKVKFNFKWKLEVNN